MQLHFKRPSMRKNRVIRLETLEERTTPAVWTAQGPGPTLGGQSENVAGSNPVVGAIHTVLPHPTNPDILYVGGVNGGIWKSTNATAVSPTWAPLTDTLTSQSMGALEFDPTDPTNQTIIAGFGLYSSFASIGASRAGLIKSTDGGANWTPITGGGALIGRNISGIAARGNTIVISVNFASPTFDFPNIGIFRSTNGGASFTQISSGNGAATGLPGGISYDLATDPTNNAVMYTSIKFAPLVGGVNGVFKSTDTGATWTRVSNAAMDALIQDTPTSNIEISVGTSNNVFVGIVNNGQIAGIFRSGNGGSSWTAMDLPKTSQGSAINVTGATFASPIVITSASAHGLSSGNMVVVTGVTGNTNANGTWYVTPVTATTFRLNGSAGNASYAGSGTWQRVSGLQPREKPEQGGAQGSVHFSILADPTNPNIVYIGGDRQDTPFPNSIGANNFSGRLFRGDASITPNPEAIPSPQWTPLTHIGTSNNSSPHADSRDMEMDANGNIIEGDDGGVYRRSSPLTTTGVWTSLAGVGLQVGELHNIAYDNRTNTLTAGTQDNASPQQTAANSLTWSTVQSSGDGGDVAVDETTLAGSNQSIRYSSSQNLGGFRRERFNSSNTLLGTTFISLPGAFAPNFVTPVELNNVDPQRLVIAGSNASNGMFESLNQGGSWTQLTGPGFGTFPQNAIVYGHPGNIDVIWAGSAGSVYRRTTAGGSLLVTTAPFPGGGTVWDIVLGSTPDTAFVVDSDQVFRTIDGGASWTNITGTILSAGALDLRSIEYVPAPTGDFLVVGTRTGVYSALVSSPTAWSLFGTGLPIVPVFDMEYDATDDVLVLGTFGRGAWKMNGVSLSDSDIVVNANQTGGNGQNNGTADSFRLAINGANLEIYIQGTLSRTVLFSLVNSITVQGSGDADTLNMTGGLISVPGGMIFTGAGGTDILLGPDAVASWSITGAGIGTLTSGAVSLPFTGLESVTGGTDVDSFTFAGGSLAGSINGGGGIDTIIGDNVGRSYSVTGSNSGSLTIGVSATFSNIENFTAGTGNDTFAFSATGALAGTLDAGAGDDSLSGTNAGHTFTLSGANTGSISAMVPTFISVETVAGGSGPDTLVIPLVGSLTGSFSGGGGLDTIDLSALAALAITPAALGGVDGFDISGVPAIAGGLFNINSILGSANSDTLTGRDVASTWTISSADGGIYTDDVTARTLAFVSFEALNGGSAVDQFRFTASGTFSGPITGGGASDSVTGDDSSRTFNLTGSDSGNIASILANGFTSIENILGGLAADAFVFSAAGVLTGTLNGGNGSNTLTGNDSALAYSITGANAGDIGSILVAGFSNVENLQAGTANDTFTFGASGSLTGTLQAGSGNDELIGNDGNLTYAITGSNAGSIVGVLPAGFSGIEDITGGTGSDTFQMNGGSLTGTVDSGAGNDLIRLNSGSLTGTLLGNTGDDTFELNGGSFSGTLDGGADDDEFFLNGGSMTGLLDGGTENDLLTGSSIGQTFNITGTNAGSVTGLVSAFANVETLAGSSGSDAFNFRGSGILNGTIDGGTGTDSLSGTDAGHSFAITGSNAGTVSAILVNGFSGIENLTGGAGGDSFQFNTPGALSGAIDGGAGSDTILGDNAARSYNLTGANAGTIGTLLGTGFTNVENLQGGSAVDTFTFGSGSSLSGSVAGGGGNDTLTGDNVGRTYSITAPNAGTIVGLSGFIEIENLVAGSSGDTLVRFPLGSLSGTFDGRGGSDTADLSPQSVAQAVFLTGSNSEGFSASLAGVGTAKGLDHIVATSKNNDQVVGLGVASSWQVKAGTNQTYYRRTATGETLYLSGFEQMFGNAATDAYNVDFSAGVPIGTTGLTLNGGGGSDSINVIGTAEGDSFSIVVGTIAVNGRTIKHSAMESIAVRGGNGSDTFVAGTGLPVGLAILELFGDAGNDFAKVSPSTNTRIVFNGGVGTDRLRLDTTQTGVPLLNPPPGVLSGTYFFAFHKQIDFLSVETREFGDVP